MNKLKFILYAIPLLLLFSLSPKIEASVIEYNVSINNETTIDAFNTVINEPTRFSTDYIQIINDSIQFSFNGTWPFGAIFWYDNSSSNMSYIGWHNLKSYDYRGTLLGTIPESSLPDISSYIPNNATHFRLTSDNDVLPLIVSYDNPTPYTIEQKNPYYDQLLFNFTNYEYPTVFVQGTDYSQLHDDWNFGDFWRDDTGYLVGSTAGDNHEYASSVGYLNLVGEHIYLNMPLPANITEPGTYDVWFSLFDYNGNFKTSYRPTSNNISVSTLRDLGGYYFRLNYTENYALLPDAQNFNIEIWRSETNNLLTFYDTDSTSLIQLAIGQTNEYQPGNDDLWVDSSTNNFDIRDYLTNNNIDLPTKQGHTLLGFSYDYWYDLGNRQATVIYPDPSFVFGVGMAVDVVYWPVFEENIIYDVTFTDYDDSIIEVVTVEPGETAIPTQQPTRQGYVFAYWEPPVTDIQGNLTTKAIYYVPITWLNTDFSTIRIDQVIEGQIPSPPTLEGYTRTWTPDIDFATEPETYVLISQTQNQTSGITETSGTTIIYRTQLPDDYSGITDLFGGVFGAIVGTIMILGTIDLFGVQLSSLFWLFFAGSGFFMIWRFVR
jgi:hypothetical protein